MNVLGPQLRPYLFFADNLTASIKQCNQQSNGLILDPHQHTLPPKLGGGGVHLKESKPVNHGWGASDIGSTIESDSERETQFALVKPIILASRTQVVRQKPPWAAITLLKMATGRDRALLPRTAAKGPRFSPPDKRARQIGLVAASSCVERDWAALQGIHGARTGSRPRVPHVGAGRPLFYSCCESDPRGSGRPAR
jgi:hypothetical protein